MTRNIVGVQPNKWMDENNGKSLGLVIVRSVCENLTLSLISYGTLGKLLYLSEIQFLHLYHDDSKGIYFTKLLLR